MPKAKLSQMATTWLDEEKSLKGKKLKAQPKKKQTFSLEIETIKHLWGHRVKTGKTISRIIDELVFKYIPKN